MHRFASRPAALGSMVNLRVNLRVMFRTISKKVVTTIAIGFVVVLAAGCGDDSGGSTASDPTPPDSTPADSTPADSTPADSNGEETTTEAPTTEAPTTTVSAPAFPTPEQKSVEAVLGLGRPVVIGHAGGDKSWPHSTMFGFREAAVAGTEVLEMDVQLTGDGTLVVIHDDTTRRTTETDERVRDLTLDELQALDSGYWWSDDWPNHERTDDAYVYRGVRTGEIEPPTGYTPDDFRVETFRTIAETFPDHLLDIEIKVPDGDDGESDIEFAIEGARVLAEEVEELGRTDSVVVVSFDDEVIGAFSEIAPDVATSPGLDALPAWFLEGQELLPTHRVLQVPPEFDGLDVLTLPGFLEKAEAEDLAIWVWPNDIDTQENPDFYESLLDFGVGGIIAGHPDLAVERYREIGAIP